MLKKTMALVLTLVMTAALAVPMIAFASSDYDSSDYKSASSGSSEGLSSGAQRGSYELEYDTQTDVPTLKLTITGGGGLVMNPYGISRSSTEAAFGSISTASTDRIISTRLTVTSRTDVPVKIGATVKAEIGKKTGTAEKDAIQLATSIDQTKDTTKKVALWLLASENVSNLKLDNAKSKTTNVSGKINTVGVLPIKTKYVSKATEVNVNDSIFTLDRGKDTEKSCVLQFVGDMVQQPKDNPWLPDDTITPTLILDFQLQKDATPTTSTSTSSGG